MGGVAPDVGSEFRASDLPFRQAFDIGAAVVRNLLALAPFGNRWGLDTESRGERVLCTEDVNCAVECFDAHAAEFKHCLIFVNRQHLRFDSRLVLGHA